MALACGSNADAPPGADEGPVGSATGARTSTATGASGGVTGVGGGAGTVSTGTGAVASGGSAAGGQGPTTGGIGAQPSTGGAGAAPIGGGGGFFTGGTGGVAQGGGEAVFDAGSDPLRNRVEPGGVCDRFATIQCAGEAYCCDNPGRTFDQCYAAQVAACRDEVFLDSISQNPVTGYSVDAAEPAFTEFERLASECDPAIALWATSSTGLRAVTLGTIAPGGDCKPPGVTFDVATGAAHAVSCTNSDTTACLPTLLDWTCSPRGQAGADCFTDLNCVDGLWCDNPDLSLTGDICQPRKADGQPCVEPNECASLTCKGGTCVAATVQTAYCLAQ